MRHAEITLPGESSSVPTARHFVESILTSWGQPDHGWAAALLISELAANCTLHARTPFTVRVELDGQDVRLQVSDGSLQTPSVRNYGTSATTGRGLRLVEELSLGWGVHLRENGKTVWALLRTTDAGAGTADDGDEDVDALLAAFADDEPDVGGATRLLSRACWPTAA